MSQIVKSKITVVQIFESVFDLNLKTLKHNAHFCNKNNFNFIVLDNTDNDLLLQNIRNIQIKNKFEYIKKKFIHRTDSLINMLSLVETEKVAIIYELDEIAENFAKQNFQLFQEKNNLISTIFFSEKLNLNIIKNNKTNKFYNNNYFFIFDKQNLIQILNKINSNKLAIKNWSIEILYFYILALQKELNFKLEKINKYLINSLDYESFNQKEIFIAKKYKNEYRKLKLKFTKNIFQKIKIKLGFI